MYISLLLEHEEVQNILLEVLLHESYLYTDGNYREGTAGIVILTNINKSFVRRCLSCLAFRFDP